MINEKEIMPFNFFKYGGIYTGGHNGMRYKIERTGEKPDYVLNVLIWQGPYASTAMKEEDITAKEFEYSEEGRSVQFSGYKICMILILTAGKMHHQLIR